MKTFIKEFEELRKDEKGDYNVDEDGVELTLDEKAEYIVDMIEIMIDPHELIDIFEHVDMELFMKYYKAWITDYTHREELVCLIKETLEKVYDTTKESSDTI